MTLVQKLRLNKNLFNAFDANNEELHIPNCDLVDSILEDLLNIGFSTDESYEIMFSVEYDGEINKK